MIKNDFRYIIKKIVIGLGIFIGIFYFKSCNVHALNDQWYTLMQSQSQPGFPCFENNHIYTYVINGNTYEFKVQNGGIYFNNTYVTSDSNVCRGFVLGTNSNNQVVLYYYTNQGYFMSYYNNWGNIPNITEFPFVINNLAQSGNVIKLTYEGNTLVGSSSPTCTNGTIHNKNNCFWFNNYNFNVYGIRMLRMIYNDNSNSIYYYTNFGTPVIIPPTESKIVSLNPQQIVNDNVLLGFNFELEFDNFDTSNFKYYYKFDNGNPISITTNNYNLNYNMNGTLYVWTEDLEENVIDSESFTISDIGDIVDSNNMYDILFSSHGKGVNDNQLYGVYTNVDLNVVYKPKTDYLLYQYQYVNENSSLDNNNWVTHDSNILDLNVNVNGTLYARILDDNDNVLYSATFTNSIIGDEIVYNVDNDEVNSFYSGLKAGINYNAPISNLLLFPVTLFSSILNGMNSTCVDYNLGNLWGTNLKLPCVNVRQYLGDSLYLTIDLILSGVLIFRIMTFIIRCYNGLIFMKKNPVDDFTGDGE